jgi:fumarate reductase subunit C
MTLGTLIVFVLWFMLSFIIAKAASQRGRRAIDWFALSILTSPVLAALFLLLFPPVAQHQQSYRAVDDRVLQESIEIGELHRTTGNERSIKILWAIFFVLIFLVVLIIAKFSNPSSVKEIAPPSAAISGATSSEAAPQLTCGDILNSLDTSYATQLIDPIINFIGQQGEFGLPVDRRSYLLTECRLRENQFVREAVDNLVQQRRTGHLPQIPISGATSSAYDRAIWVPFDKWVRHQGPRPNILKSGAF